MNKIEEPGEEAKGAKGSRWIFREVLDSRVRYLRDTDGRPLGEQRVPDLYASVETELAQCPYRGSRYHHPKAMNVSALRQMTSNWPAILGGLLQVHREYRGLIATGPLTIFDFYRIIGMGVLLPAYVALRARDPLRDGELPVWLGGVYKVLIGIHAPVGQLMIRKLLAGGASEPLPSAESLLEYVESTQALIGNREVCAGPPALILRALRVILSGESDEPVASAPFHETLGGARGLAEFSREATDLLLLHFIFTIRTRQRAVRLATLVRNAGAGGAPQSVVDDVLSRLHSFEAGQSGSMIELCRRVEKIQGIDMDALTSALARQVGLGAIKSYSFSPVRRVVEGGAWGSLAELIEDEWAACRAEESAFLTNATELSRSVLAALGHATSSEEEIQLQDLAQVSGKTLGDLLREISSESFRNSK